MKIYLGGDHAGFVLKEKLDIFLKDIGYEVEDLGPYELDEEDDYPDFVSKVAKMVQERGGSVGIVLGGSGQGEAIQANRFKGIRATVYYGGDLEILRKSREHNNANILSLGARFMNEAEAKEAVKTWLNTPFTEEERHKRRIEKIEKHG